MQIINGRWVDDNNNSVNNFNVSQLLEIGRNVKMMYGKNITYERIALVSYIRKLTRTEEEDLTYVLSQEGVLSKLAGY